MNVYTTPLPRLRDLLKVGQAVNYFPATRNTVLRAAVMVDAPEEVIEFLLHFPSYATFDSRSNFMLKCEELELLINEERLAEPEYLHSQQE